MLGKTFTKDAVAALAGCRARGRAAPRRARPQGDPRRAVRSPLARARPVRLPSGSRPPRRVRDALEARASSAPPGRRRVPARPHSPRTRTRSSRSSRRTISPRTRPLRTPRRGGDQSQAQEMLARAGRARRVARRGRRGSPLLRAGSRAHRGPVDQGHAHSQAGEMAARAADPDGASRLLEESISLYESEGDTHSAARVSTRLARIERFTGQARRGDRAAGARVRRHLRLTSPTRISRCWPHGLPTHTGSVGDLERAAERAELALDIAEAQGYTEVIVDRARGEGGRRAQPWAPRGRTRAPEAGSLRSHSSTA